MPSGEEPYENRHRAPLGELEDFLRDVGQRLPEPVIAFLIGGCAMTLRNLKDATKDADVIVRTAKERKLLAEVMRSLGYSLSGVDFFRVSHPKEYEGFRGDMWRRDKSVGLDVFEGIVMDAFHLTDGMAARATERRTYGKLELRLCSNEDIFLFKSITSRPDDTGDVLRLAQTGLDVRVMAKELRHQPKRKFGEPWAEYVAEQLRKIEARTKVPIPWISGLLD